MKEAEPPSFLGLAKNGKTLHNSATGLILKLGCLNKPFCRVYVFYILYNALYASFLADNLP
jgi:hypothetical protein